MDAKFRQDDNEISFDLTKICERFDEISSNFRENKERKTPNFVCLSFAQYCTSNFFVLIGQKLTGEFMWKFYAAFCPSKLVD